MSAVDMSALETKPGVPTRQAAPLVSESAGAAVGALVPNMEGDRHVVDALIEQRARHLRANKLAWPLIRTFLYPLLHYRTAVKMADEILPLSGQEVLEYCSTLLDLQLDCQGTEHIPREGGFIAVANHPSGIADGVAIYDAIKQVRSDMTFFANRDAIRVNERLSEVLIPVEYFEDQKSHARSRETLKHTVEAMKGGRAVVLFPSGRIAKNIKGTLHEQDWMATGVGLAKKYNVPLVPINVRMRNSRLYYFFWKISPELRDMTLFHELLNKRRKTYGLTIGAPVRVEDLPSDPAEATRALQHLTTHELGTS